MSTAVFHQIAGKVGVSPRTVQRILCSELKDTRPAIVQRARRIRDLAAAMDYRPNLAARATASGKFGCVSLIRPTTSWATHFSAELAEGIEDELAIHDIHLAVHRLSDQALASAEALPKALRTLMSDGLLVNYTHRIPAAMCEVIDRDAIPTVWINTRFAHDSVYPDDFAAARLATQHLIGTGRKRIAYLQLTHGTQHSSENEREAGYRSAMEAAGLEPAVTRIEGPMPLPTPLNDARLANAMSWLARTPRPDGVVTYSGRSGQPLVAAALATGLRVPDDLGVVTIEDRVANELGLPLTTVVLNVGEMGKQAVRMLMQKIRKPRERLAPRAIECSLVPGQTA
jgi:DNA-binding LacI/PurR family transcriptional regulator